MAVLLISAVAPFSADAEPLVRLVEPDGTIHLTNAPDDPQYRRMGRVAPESPQMTAGGEQRLLYAAEIGEAASRFNVPRRLVEAVIRAESAFNPCAVSPKGAQGLMQLMPATASLLGVRNPFDPRENIVGGVQHLRRLLDRYANDLSLALAAYNAGEGAVDWYGSIPPYVETQQYVRTIMRAYERNSGR